MAVADILSCLGAWHDVGAVTLYGVLSCLHYNKCLRLYSTSPRQFTFPVKGSSLNFNERRFIFVFECNVK